MDLLFQVLQAVAASQRLGINIFLLTSTFRKKEHR
jgi:hypothetical protein